MLQHHTAEKAKIYSVISNCVEWVEERASLEEKLILRLLLRLSELPHPSVVTALWSFLVQCGCFGCQHADGVQHVEQIPLTHT